MKQVIKLATFAGNFSFRTYLECYSPSILPAPRAAKKATSIRSCSRRYESSVPTRYIPKKYSKSEEVRSVPPKKKNNTEETELNPCLDSKPSGNEDSSRMPGLASEPLQNSVPFVRDADAVESSNVGDDTDFFEWENEHEEISDQVEVSFGGDLNEGYTKKMNEDKREAERIAIEALATRAFTAVELQKKLRRKRFSLNLINEVVTDLQRRGLINDYLYAETFSQSRFSTSTWGPNRIKHALQRKGVSKTDAEMATKHVFESADYSGDTLESFGMSKLSMDHVFVQASKQWLRDPNLPHEKRKSRIVRWLQYRGFSWRITSHILKKLEAQHPP